MRYRCVLAAVGCAILNASSNAQMMLVGSWFDESVKLLDVSPGSFNAFAEDFVPSGSGGLGTPDGLAWGADRNLYVASNDSSQVLRYHGRTGAFLGVFASEGLSQPGNLQFGPDGLLYVCEKQFGQVIRFDPENGEQIDIFIEGDELIRPVGLAWNKDVLYVSDFRNGNGLLQYDAGTGAFLGQLTRLPTSLIVRVGDDGNIWASAHQTDDITIYDPGTGDLIRQIRQVPMDCPVGHVIAPNGTMIVASWLNNRIVRFDPGTGEYLGDIAFDVARLRQPNDLLFIIEQCPADLTTSSDPNDSEFGVPDGDIDSEDFFYYLDRFAAGDSEADIDGDGDTDADDFFAYLDLFAAGC